jgi:hypothetical protein
MKTTVPVSAGYVLLCLKSLGYLDAAFEYSPRHSNIEAQASIAVEVIKRVLRAVHKYTVVDCVLAEIYVEQGHRAKDWVFDDVAHFRNFGCSRERGAPRAVLRHRAPAVWANCRLLRV